MVERARAAGVRRMITISTRVDKFASISALAESYPEVFCTVGDHPDHVHEGPEASLDQLLLLAQHPKMRWNRRGGARHHYDNAPRDLA